MLYHIITVLYPATVRVRILNSVRILVYELLGLAMSSEGLVGVSGVAVSRLPGRLPESR